MCCRLPLLPRGALRAKGGDGWLRPGAPYYNFFVKPIFLALLLLLGGCSDREWTLPDQPGALLLTHGHGLADPNYAIIRNALTGAGYKVSAVDVPCHAPGEAQLQCWRQMYNRGESFDAFVAGTVARMDNIQVVVGISRAGYIALLIAAVNREPVKYVLLAPVVDLFDLAEFDGAVPMLNHDARNLPLTGKQIFLAIGRADTRVSTATSIDLAARFRDVHLVLTDTPDHSQPRVEPEILHWLAAHPI